MMKKIILLLLLAFLLKDTIAQKWTVGAKLDLGIGWVSSNNLQENFIAQRLANPEIQRFDESSRLGMAFGVGGTVEYNFTEHFALLGELTWNTLNTEMDIDYTRNKVKLGDGEITSIHSELSVKTQ